MMPQTPHIEKHFTGNESIRDIVIGMSDGLTVPFALAAGLSGAAATSSIIVTAGMAEIAAGAIAMGLGGYLAARSDIEHYQSERKREQQEVIDKPDFEVAEVVQILESYGLTAQQSATVMDAFQKNPEKWVDYMMEAELHLEKPDPKRALTSGLTIGGAYIAGGIIPLVSYVFIPDAHTALLYSVGLTMAALLVFGAFKAYFTGVSLLRGAMQTLLVGGLAAAAAFLIARLIS
jgi:VIT1/CCC1 family predicted Fe2+/Mn2+ transporter